MPALFVSCLRTKTWRGDTAPHLDLERLYDDFPEGSTPETSLKADSFGGKKTSWESKGNGIHPQCHRFPKIVMVRWLIIPEMKAGKSLGATGGIGGGVSPLDESMGLVCIYPTMNG